MLHLQIADIARRSPANLIPEPPSKNGRISRVDAEPQTMTVAPPVSVSQPPPAAPSSRASTSSRASFTPPAAERRSRVPPFALGAVAIAIVGGGLFVSRRYLPLGPRDTAITAPPPSVATSTPPLASSLAIATPPSAEPEPAPPPATDPAPAAKKGVTKNPRPLAGAVRPRASSPATTTVAPPPAPPTPPPAATKKPDLHPNPYGNGE
jgi:hypothetical protein